MDFVFEDGILLLRRVETIIPLLSIRTGKWTAEEGKKFSKRD
jgi:hypothetical protein